MTNFALLGELNEAWGREAERAEEYFSSGDPNACLFKLRQVAEAMCQDYVFGRTSVDVSFLDTLTEGARSMPDWLLELLHELRKTGNKAVHQTRPMNREAATGLHTMFRVMLWFVGQEAPHLASTRVKFEKPRMRRRDRELAEALEAQLRLAQELEQSKEALEANQAELARRNQQRTRPVFFHAAFERRLADFDQVMRQRLFEPLQALRNEPMGEDPQPLGVSDDTLYWRPLPVRGARSLGVLMVMRPGQETILFIYLGTIEECQAWGATVRVEVHPLLGSVQVFHESNVDSKTRGALLEGYTDEELARCGVPEGLMTLVRTFTDQDALIEHIELLPDEAAEALWALSGGATLEEARASAGLAQHTPGEQTSTELDIAVEHTASRRQLAEVDDEELARMLDAPLALWRTYLHPSQRHAVEMRANGPIRVLGGAGTGKTVALLHRVGFLLREVFTGEERVLVTTFTRNLTLELESALRDLLTDEEFERVDVHNLHSVATRVLREQGLSMELARDDDVDAAWAEALEVLPKDLARRFDRAFFEYEWKHVILAGDIYDSTGYMEARRSRMGTRVHRLTRVRLWPVFEAYREALGRRGVSHWDDLLSQAAYMMKGEGGYAAVLSDEVQDYTPAALRLLRALVPKGPNDMFLVGDAHQRIYGAMANFKACGIHIVGRSVRLKVNYRTTERIRQVAMGALAGCVYDDLDGGDDDLDGYHSIRAGVEPVMWHGESKDDELDFLDELLTRWIVEEDVEPSEICIATRLGVGVNHYTRGLEARNFTLERVTKDVPAHELPSGLRIATFHRLKGTEFSRVVLVGVNAFTFPFIHQDSVFPDEQAREEVLKTERALFYVAATRARDHLVVTGWGDRSEYLTTST